MTRLLVAAVMAAFLVVGLVSGSHADTGSSTAYHSCDGSSSSTAWGTKVGPLRIDERFPAGWGVVANNYLPLGTWIEVTSPHDVGGRHFFRVEDRGGPGFALDFYAKSCGWMNTWGRRPVTFHVVPRSQLWRGAPRRGWAWRCCWAQPHFLG